MVSKLMGKGLAGEQMSREMVGCAGLDEAREALDAGAVHLVATALVLADGDGLALARMVRESAGQAYVPIIVVSGEVQSRLEDRSLSDDVTDYFDKAQGHTALAAFIRGYVQPEPIAGARVLYVEDSKVVATATKRMFERQGLTVLHFVSAEDAIDHLHAHRDTADAPGADLVLTDVYLKGELSGRDVLAKIRGELGWSKRRLPVLVMTGDENRDNQSQLLREGANDLVLKPIEERLLVTKVLFQLRAAKLPEQRAFDA